MLLLFTLTIIRKQDDFILLSPKGSRGIGFDLGKEIGEILARVEIPVFDSKAHIFSLSISSSASGSSSISSLGPSL